MNNITNKYSPEVHDRAVRVVSGNQGQPNSRWSAILSIFAKIGCAPQTLRADIASIRWAQNAIALSALDELSYKCKGLPKVSVHKRAEMILKQYSSL